MSDVMREVAELILAGGGDELIEKMNPAQSDLATHDKRKRAFTAGLSAVGATAGAAGLGLAASETHGGYRKAREAQQAAHEFHAPRAKFRALKTAVKSKKLAAGLVPLEVAGLGGELMATKILHGDTKKKTPVVKADSTDMRNNAGIPRTKGQLTMAVISNPKVRKKGLEYTKKGAGALKKLPDKVITTNQVEKALRFDKEKMRAAYNERVRAGTAKPNGKVRGKFVQPVPQISKADDTEVDVIWNAEISKADADKQQIFGWASVVEVNGEPVVDLQGDYISVDEMEKAGYEYVMKSRKGGDMHLRDDWSPVQKSEMIESFIVTPEKRDAMGLPDSVPTGWWVGFKVQDPDVWAKVKSGERTGFSIHGSGRRSPVTDAPERS